VKKKPPAEWRRPGDYFALVVSAGALAVVSATTLVVSVVEAASVSPDTFLPHENAIARTATIISKPNLFFIVV
jgi:hypothetical protein